MRTFYLYCLGLLYLLPGPFIRAADLSYSTDDYVVEVWNTDSGLPQSAVTSIAQTPDGYLWVGTLNGGLARFDGIRFVSFHPGNTPELKSFEIHNLTVDSAGTLWIGLVEGDVLSYQDAKFHFERRSANTPASWLRGVLWRRGDNVLIYSSFGWLFRGNLGHETNRWETFQTPDGDFSSVPCEDHDGVIWYRMADHRLGQIRGTNASVMAEPPGLRGHQINAVVSDAKGRVWVGTEKELAVWDGNTFVNMTPTNGTPDVDVIQISVCPDDSLWVQTKQELGRCAGRKWLARVDPVGSPASYPQMYVDSRYGVWMFSYGDGLWHVSSDGKVSRVGEQQGLPSGLVDCLFEDREGNIWVGLRDGGLTCLRPRKFHTVWPASGLEGKAARSVCEDSSGAMWFGTAGRTVLRWRDNVFSSFLPAAEGTYNEITVLPDGHSGIWVGSVQNGLLNLDGEKFSRPFPPAEIGTVARALYRDRAGAVWIGSEFGLFRWDRRQLKRFTPADGFSAAYVLSITEDAAGDLWVGTAVGELRRFKAGKFETFRPADELGHARMVETNGDVDPMQARGRGMLSGGERFWALHPDASGGLWIGTLGGGLLRFKDGRFTRFTTRDGLPNEHVSQILEDGLGNLWLGTLRGIDQIKKSELETFVPDGKHVLQFTTYGKFDGLPAVECLGGSQPSCWQSRDGHLWFTTVQGAVWIDPAALRFNPLPPPVLVEDVFVDGRRILAADNKTSFPQARPPKELVVGAGRHYFEFKFTALSFIAPDKVRFKWRLEGLEDDWVDGGDLRTVSYSFIPPGNYQFQVQACNNYGVWSKPGDPVKLTVLPYFWQTWWFRLMAVLGLAAGLMMIYSLRVARLRAIEKLRMRIARDLHDEVGANLGSISLLAQMMEQHPSSADATQVRGIAVQTIDTLRDIIWFIDPTHHKLSDVVARLEETSRLMLPALAYNFEQSGDFHSVTLSLEFRRNVPLLFKEALHNILKHSHATKAAIHVRRNEKQFEIRIHDNGVGFLTDSKSSGNGLKNMKRRAKEIGGRLEIESSPGNGATITLIAPIT